MVTWRMVCVELPRTNWSFIIVRRLAVRVYESLGSWVQVGIWALVYRVSLTSLLIVEKIKLSAFESSSRSSLSSFCCLVSWAITTSISLSNRSCAATVGSRSLSVKLGSESSSLVGLRSSYLSVCGRTGLPLRGFILRSL